MRDELITEMARALCGAYRVDGKCPLCAGDCIDWQDNVDAIRAILPIVVEACAEIADEKAKLWKQEGMAATEAADAIRQLGAKP